MEILDSMNSKDTRQSTEPLSIDIGEQTELFHQLNSLSQELNENPFVIPDWVKNSLKSIPLRRPTKQNPGAYMNIESGSKRADPHSAPDGFSQALSHATITLTDKSKPVSHAQSLYTFRPGVEVWESWGRPRQTQPDATYSNIDFLDILDSQIPDELFSSLYDKNPSGSEIVQLLTGHLAKAAKTKAQLKRYSTSSIISGGEDYVSSRTTEFFVNTRNKRIYHALLVSATHNTDYGPIKETIGYSTEADNQKFYTAGGFVRFEAGVETPQARLDAYAVGKQQFGETLDVLTAGRTEIASHYFPRAGGDDSHLNNKAA